MRAALLPAGGDPFLNAYWLRHYAAVWADEVDELRVIVCGQPDPTIRDYLAGLAASLPHVVMRFAPRTDHGTVIRWLVEETEADEVMLCEDDAFVRMSGAVASAFEQIERGEVDLVGCPRGSATDELIEAAKARFGNIVTETGEEGPNLWPCFLFAKRADLLATDRNFSVCAFDPGDVVPGLPGWTPRRRAVGDTFVAASLQLRHLRLAARPGFRSDLWKMRDWENAPWFHVGSLSSGYGQYFAAGMRDEDFAAFVASIRGDLLDWNKRMSWWQRVTTCWDGALPEHHADYLAELSRFTQATGMRQEAVDEWTRLYDRLITWPQS